MPKISSLLRSNKDSELWKGVASSTPFSVDDILNTSTDSKDTSGLKTNLSSCISGLAQQNLRNQQFWIENIRKLHLVLNTNPLLLPSCLSLPLTYPSSVTGAASTPLVKNYSCQNPAITPLNILSFYDGIVRQAQTYQTLQSLTSKKSSDIDHSQPEKISSPGSAKKEEETPTKEEKSASATTPSNTPPPLSPIHALEKLASNTFSHLENSKYSFT